MSNNFKVTKVELNKTNVGALLLRSEAIDDLLVKLGEKTAQKAGAEVKLRKGYGKRHRVYVNMSLSDAAKDNKLLKATSK